MVMHGMGNDAGAPSASDRTSWVSEIEAALRSAAASYKVAPEARHLSDGGRPPDLCMGGAGHQGEGADR
jgi:hypothetical protein